MPHMIQKKNHENVAAAQPQLNALPIKTFFDIHSGCGIIACDFSVDSKYLVTLGNEAETPICTLDISGEPQKSLKVNPENPFEIISNGSNTVNFYVWDIGGSIVQNVPLLNSKDFSHTPAPYTFSMFIPTKRQAITATVDGDVIIWDSHSLNNLSVELGIGKYACVKFMKLHQSSINFATTIGHNYIVTGGDDGSIKIFDLQLRLIMWFEKLRAGPVTSISFCSTFAKATSPHESIVSDLNIPEIVVGTAFSRVLLLSRREPKRGNLSDLKLKIADNDDSLDKISGDDGPEIQSILETQYESVHALATHPNLRRFAVGGYSAIGFANGNLRIIDANTLKEIDGQRSVSGEIMHTFFSLAKKSPTATAAITTDKSYYQEDHSERITQVSFSDCGNFLAACDAQHAVSLFKKEGRSRPNKNIEGIGKAVEKLASGEKYTVWIQIGKCKAHYKEIISLIFIAPTAIEPTKTRLISVSEDRHVAEYDVSASTITNGIKLISLKRIEQTARPVAATWHPSLTLASNSIQPKQQTPKKKTTTTENSSFSPVNTYLLTCNSDYKICLHNSTTQLCRKTTLGPTFGGPLKNLLVVPNNDNSNANMNEEDRENVELPPAHQQTFSYVAYSSQEKVVGLTKLPLDGNPHRFMGLIAHPCSISKIATTHDGAFLFTSGYQDATVHMWAINSQVLDVQIAMGGKGLEPFLDMLDDSGAGENGAFYKEMEDYFYYAQLR
ncbi:Cilia- and flagella-associated protein 251, partial [Physocladia obscura]